MPSVLPTVARRAAAVDLRAPAVAVWPGEVVVVAAPEHEAVSALLRAAAGVRRETLRVAEPPVTYGAARSAVALAGLAAGGAAVLAGVVLRPGARGRRTLAALRLTVARRAPCRCLWLVGGRVYPE